MKMSKPICLLFALVILTTILCNNSVCSQRGYLKQSAVCGCRIHHNNNQQCIKNLNPKTADEYNKIPKCICQNRQKNLKKASKKMFLKMCSDSNYPNIPL